MKSKDRTDDDLIAALRRGGAERRDAWEYIYKNWRAVWVGTIVKSGGTPDEADEAMHEVATRFEEKVTADGFQLESATLRTYLMTFILREWADKNERKARTSSTPSKQEPKFEEGVAESAEKGMMREDLRAATDRLISILGNRCRRILGMFGDGFGMDEIAEAEGLKDADKAKKEKYECQTKLKNHLRDNPTLADQLKKLLRND